MKTLVLATRNRHKALEIQAVLGSGLRYLTLLDLPPTPVPVEDADTFAGNATKKVLSLALWLAAQPDFSGTGEVLVLADDSGLEVDALAGAPGVHSARFAARDNPGQSVNSTDAENNAKLLRLLEALPLDQRTARFRCIIAAVRLPPDPASSGTPAPLPLRVAPPSLFEGTCEGHILFAPRGHAGFGYDPLFQPIGHTATFAELGETTKNQISHRARALVKLKAWLEGPTPVTATRTCPG